MTQVCTVDVTQQRGRIGGTSAQCETGLRADPDDSRWGTAPERGSVQYSCVQGCSAVLAAPYTQSHICIIRAAPSLQCRARNAFPAALSSEYHTNSDDAVRVVVKGQCSVGVCRDTKTRKGRRDTTVEMAVQGWCCSHPEGCCRGSAAETVQQGCSWKWIELGRLETGAAVFTVRCSRAECSFSAEQGAGPISGGSLQT